MEIKVYLRLNEIGWEFALEAPNGLRSRWRQTNYTARMMPITVAAIFKKQFEGLGNNYTARVFVPNAETETAR